MACREVHLPTAGQPEAYQVCTLQGLLKGLGSSQVGRGPAPASRAKLSMHSMNIGRQLGCQHQAAASADAGNRAGAHTVLCLSLTAVTTPTKPNGFFSQSSRAKLVVQLFRAEAAKAMAVHTMRTDQPQCMVCWKSGTQLLSDGAGQAQAVRCRDGGVARVPPCLWPMSLRLRAKLMQPAP